MAGGQPRWGSPHPGPCDLMPQPSSRPQPRLRSAGCLQRAGLSGAEAGSQAGHADPPASPRLPRKCGWWPFQEPTPLTLGERGQGQVGLGAGCVRLCLVPWFLPCHPPPAQHTHRRAVLTRCMAEPGPTVRRGLQASVSVP